MSRMIIISNRLPVTVKKTDQGIDYQKSIGGLATGLKSYHENGQGLWVGWPGIAKEELTKEEQKEIETRLIEEYKCVPVFLSEEDIEDYYHGFSNETIWPLFHYFSNMTIYDSNQWQAYKRVNQLFFGVVKKYIKQDVNVWVHDYQLMLLPEAIKNTFPDNKVGFFLHIPFPSFEIFRQLVWRKEILQGLLGADLIGFHTYDYVRHFLSSTKRLLGLENTLNQINYEDRLIKVDVFPMGINYEWFSKERDDEVYLKEKASLEENLLGMKLILSIDRLDYTKGIKERIRAFEALLTKYPEYIGNIRLILVVAPSRVEVETYKELRQEIDILVSEVNGRFGTVSWMPIWFYFKSFPQESLIAFYRRADVLLVTPVRDGMNLVVKEYIASRTDNKGMVVISETTGAASEVGETVVVNANDIEAIAEGLKTALEMPENEQIAINKQIRKRLKRYTVEFWAEQFINTLETMQTRIYEATSGQNLLPELPNMEKSYLQAKKRLIFLDYDGTLVGFKAIPEKAKPDAELRKIIKNLAADPKNDIVIISGRDHYTLEDWLGDLDIHLVASHGLWIKEKGTEWGLKLHLDNSWKDSVYRMLEIYTDRMPGAIIEEKDYSIAFHYRQCEVDLVETKLREVTDATEAMIRSLNLEIKYGNKVIEIKPVGVNKGIGADMFLAKDKYDFVLGAGDDLTDEDLFEHLPEKAYSIKVGIEDTIAKYRIKSYANLRRILKQLINVGQTADE